MQKVNDIFFKGLLLCMVYQGSNFTIAILDLHFTLFELMKVARSNLSSLYNEAVDGILIYLMEPEDHEKKGPPSIVVLDGLCTYSLDYKMIKYAGRFWQQLFWRSLQPSACLYLKRSKILTEILTIQPCQFQLLIHLTVSPKSHIFTNAFSYLHDPRSRTSKT